ncbi:uncharacterized protein EDB93DRAFT_1245152 [Suillus bovinus]|uniref:uncharacterized protein n=1 Tax=Suillus bovinus TaxID=48563 RepID=UPI001B86D5F2|nr:uncharacterized protein EDB93DRAFT_1245152 [Suillus bovinus]KAG2159346.1 hypothetical protein EDB93DRAFT_1245152 [Suillus bovinus]
MPSHLTPTQSMQPQIDLPPLDYQPNLPIHDAFILAAEKELISGAVNNSYKTQAGQLLEPSSCTLSSELPIPPFSPFPSFPVSMSNAEHSASPVDELPNSVGSGSVEHQQAEASDDQAVISAQARQRQRITQLEEKLLALKSGRTAKERQTNYYVAQGRAIRCIVTLFDSLEDLVAETDQRYDIEEDAETTTDQDRLQIGYIMFMNTMRWFFKKATEQEYKEYVQILKMLWKGADAARGDDTSKLKVLVSEWVNCEFKPDPLVNPDDKHSRGFTNDACDRADGHIVTDLSFPAFVYEKYTAKPDDLEEGLFKGKILLQAYKAVFTSPSSAKDVDGNGNGVDIIQNNRHARKSFNGLKVKKHVAQIIKMEKVTPRSIAYIICQSLPGDPLMETLTMSNFGGPLLISSKGLPVEKLSAT